MTKQEFRHFKVGDVLRILDDRRESWQPDGELIVAEVIRHGFTREAGHDQTLKMSDGHTYSGWWFDPASICLWAKATEDSH